MSRTLVFFCFVLLCDLPSRAADSDWFARTWQMEDGLPNNNVTSLAQTPDGFLWVATPLGLSRFDGVSFDEISLTNFVGHGNRGVAALLASRNDGLWVQMDRGAIVDLNADKAFAINLTNAPFDSAAQTMEEWSDGTLWISYMGGAVCFFKNGKATVISWQLGLPWGPGSSIAKDTKGRIWLARESEVGIFHDGKFQLLVRPGGRSVRLAAARAGGVWICTDGQLFHFDEGTHLESFGKLPTTHSGIEASAMIEDRHGAVWIGTAYDGLFRFSGSGFERIPVSHPEITCLLEDREGNIWAGTHGGGLNRLRPRAITLETAQNGLPFESVQSVCEDKDGTLWAVTENGLLVQRNKNGWQTAPTNSGWPGGQATCVAADLRGGVWIGTRDFHLIHWQDGKFDVLDKSHGLEISPISALMVGRNGDLWIGGFSHVLQSFQDGHFTTLSLRQNTHTVRAITQDAAGDVWIGTSRGVLLRVNGTNVIDETEKIPGVIKSIRCLYAASDGSLWIGYAGFGLGRFKAGRFGQITTAQGLFDSHISQIVPDGHGWFWLGSDRGIFKVRETELIDAAENTNVLVHSIHYGRGEGVPDLEANFEFAPGAVRSHDGRIWIPTQRALIVINPESSADDSKLPSVFLKRVAVDGETVAAYGGPLPLNNMIHLEKPTALQLPPDNREIEFDFTALNFFAPENLRLQYRLDGLDNGWKDANPERTVSFSRLPAGNYHFHVRASSSEGAWNESGASFAFTVTPFLWQQWWFQSLAFLLFGALMIFIVRYVSFRRLRSRLRALEQQAVLDKERARIARDLHDDLGGHLTEIVLLSDLIVDDPDKSNKTAQRVSDSVRQVIKRLDETVWAVNPRNDTLSQLIDYIGQFAVEFLRTAGIYCHVDAPLHVREENVSTEVRHNLFLVVKEALNNVVNHAKATEVRLTIAVSERDVRIIIEDNGRGFDHAPNNGCADGLRNMRQRIEEIGGKFDLQSKPAAGTRIAIITPLHK